MSAFNVSKSAFPSSLPPGGEEPRDILEHFARVLVRFVVPATAIAFYLCAPPEIVLIGAALAIIAILARFLFRPTTHVEKAVAALMVVALIGAGAWAYLRLHPLTNTVSMAPVRHLSDVPLDGRASAVTEDRNGTIWVGEETGEIQAIDPISRQPVGSALNVHRPIRDLQAVGRFLFVLVGHGVLIRLDPGVSPVPNARLWLGTGGRKLAAGDRSLWVTDRNEATIFRVDPARMRKIAMIHLSSRHAARATALAFGQDGCLWVVDAGLGYLYKISAKADKVVFSKPIAKDPEEILVTKSTVFVAHPGIRTLERFDAVSATAIGVPIKIDSGPVKLVAGGRFLLVIACLTGSITTYALSTGRPIGHALRVGESAVDAIYSTRRHMGWIVDSTSTSIVPITPTENMGASED